MSVDARSRNTAALVILLAAVAALTLIGSPGNPEAQQPSDTAYVAPEITDTNRLRGPRQPIFYRHDVHAGQYRMDCRYCHYGVEVSAYPSLPPIETCMGCHRIAGRAIPEVQKLVDLAASGEHVEWIKVHFLPQFVRFPHMRHVRAEITCQTCHGPIERMAQVYQYSSLKMGWCLDCHEQRRVTTDCTVCHY